MQACAYMFVVFAQHGEGDIAAGGGIVDTMYNTYRRIDDDPKRQDGMAQSFKSIVEYPRIINLIMTFFLQTPHKKISNYRFTQMKLEN